MEVRMDAMEREGVSSPRRWSRNEAGYRGMADSNWGVVLLFIADVLDVLWLFGAADLRYDAGEQAMSMECSAGSIIYCKIDE